MVKIFLLVHVSSASLNPRGRVRLEMSMKQLLEKQNGRDFHLARLLFAYFLFSLLVDHGRFAKYIFDGVVFNRPKL